MSKPEAPAEVAFQATSSQCRTFRFGCQRISWDGTLAEIETALKRFEGRVAITALHGLRGVGKTTLAAAYAERHRSEYRATWWIRALKGSFAAKIQPFVVIGIV